MVEQYVFCFFFCHLQHKDNVEDATSVVFCCFVLVDGHCKFQRLVFGGVIPVGLNLSIN